MFQFVFGALAILLLQLLWRVANWYYFRTSKMDLLASFNALHSNRYVIKKPLGSGASGTAYLAKDLARNINVCIKIYASDTSDRIRRDWEITSTLKSPHIADNFTIELFADASGKPRAASVSRYIKGATLYTFMERFRDLQPEQKNSVREALVSQIVAKTCDALVFVHDNEYGHGDLNENNIIIEPLDDSFTKLNVVIIDFDNESYSRTKSPESTHQKRDIELVKELLCSLVEGSIRETAFINIISTATTANELRNCVQAFLSVFGTKLSSLEKNEINSTFWKRVLRNHQIDVVTNQCYASAISTEFVRLANDTGTTTVLKNELQQIELERNELGMKFFRVSADVTVTTSAARTAMQKLFS